MGTSYTQVDPSIWENSKTEIKMEKESFNGPMDNYTMDNGKTISNMEVDYGKEKVHPTLASGIMVLFLALESSPIAKAKDIRDNLIIFVNRGKVPINLKMDKCTLECSTRINQMERGNTIGKMVITIRVILSMG